MEDYCKKHHIPMSKDDRFYLLLAEASHLIGKINGIALPTKNQQHFTTPDESTEPNFLKHIWFSRGFSPHKQT